MVEKWINISESPKELNQPAIYRIKLKGKDEIERLLENDEECILCIGKTKNIRKRISQFKRGMKTGNTGTHSEGRTLFIVNFFKDNDITEKDLEYTYEKKNAGDIGDGEYDELSCNCQNSIVL